MFPTTVSKSTTGIVTSDNPEEIITRPCGGEDKR